MNSWPLVLAAGSMGVFGSIHCVAMCGALQRTALRGIPIVVQPAMAAAPPGPGADEARPAPVGASRWSRFQAGRLLGYATLGVLAGLIGEGLLAAARWQPLFESVWAGLNAILLFIGIVMLATGHQPGFLQRWSRPPAPGGPRAARAGRRIGPMLRGGAWAALPCGLLYAAVGLAVLAGEPVGAAVTMLAFGLGTTVGLGIFEALTGGFGPLPQRLRPAFLPGRLDERAVFRFNGAVLALAAGAALIAALTGAAHPFC